MTITNGYATLTQFKSWISEEENLIDEMCEERVEAASRRIDELCGRCFYQVTEARVFDACNPLLLSVDDLVSVTTVKTDDNEDGVFETTWAAGTDYQLLPVKPPSLNQPYCEVKAIGGRSFPYLRSLRTRVGRVEVTGTWGWPSVPKGVYTACLILASRGLKRRHSPEGVIGFNEFGGMRVAGSDPDVMAYLNAYLPVLIA